MDNRKNALKAFADKWYTKGNERSEMQSFWVELLGIYGIERPTEYIDFEKPINFPHKKYADGYIPKTKVLIEQKSSNIKLDCKELQSDGQKLSPIEQAERYLQKISSTEQPEWIITCNFREIWVYDRKDITAAPQKITLSDLAKDPSLLDFLIKKEITRIIREKKLSFKAGKVVGKLYDMLEKQYEHPMTEADMHSLNVLCVRLVFCLYAENSGLFSHHSFYEYLSKYNASELRMALKILFDILNTKKTDRDKDLKVDYPLLYSFPYANGGLFNNHDVQITLPTFTEEIRQLLLEEASAGFNWSDISPTIFGAIFESTLNPETKHKGGMHYTTIGNIHKVIDPLFLDDLNKEFDDICKIDDDKKKTKALLAFRNKLGNLCFLDPACGSGNFLTETYICLRRLENKVIRILNNNQELFLGKDYASAINVDIKNFYGIEINDFAVAVAKTAMWIADHQMWKETQDIVQLDNDFLPLETLCGVVKGNALRMNWEDVVPKEKLNYIIGNPPFIGARVMTQKQKSELNAIFLGWKNVGNLDYVCGWYKKSADLMKDTNIRTALVSTNSVSQGEQVAVLWKPLMEDVHIDFAYNSFKWDSESSGKAHVHCVIIGFSVAPNDKPKVIFSDNKEEISQNINPYLVDAPNIFIDSRAKPLCDVPSIGIGNKPIDGGNYLFTAEEHNAFIAKEPSAEQYFRPWYGAYEFINRKPRYCLWLGGCTPNELRAMPECMKRVQAVREFRLASKSVGTVKIADKPTRFHVENMPKGNFIVVSKVSSDSRRYVPIDFMTPNVFCSDLVFIIPDATLYHFGVLTSNVHNAWMRAVCGRLGMAYRYSKDIVYNNFPWPSPTDEQKMKIEQTAQAILDARALYPDSSLADLYDECTMPIELRKAHEENDKAVMAAYGWDKKHPAYNSENIIVKELFKMYQELTSKL